MDVAIETAAYFAMSTDIHRYRETPNHKKYKLHIYINVLTSSYTH